MTETLLQTKLFIPAARSRLVPRSQLLARLDAGLDGRLTLVSAPAGFGKTTLVVHWGKQLAEAGKWQLAWFSLDDVDNDLGLFFSYLISALQKIDPGIGQTALELLRSPQANNIQVILTDLLNTLSHSSQAVVLTLDDYHRITNPAVHEALRFLIENSPPHFLLLLISRADPPFSLARLRARNQMTEIRQADLRFKQSESTEFLNRLMGLDLPQTAVSVLEKRTEGWVAGLQMAALSLQGRTDVDTFIRGFTASNRYIFDYLVEEVLARRPQGTREFLLQTAFLDRMCAPLCDAVLGIVETAESPSQQILEQLENANLFIISLDDERRWFRYHHLFADLLQRQWLRENPDLESVPHERASRWFERAGYAQEAVQYALSAADYKRAAGLLTQYSQKWLRHGEISKIVLWTERLPAAWRQQNPRLMLHYAWALFFRGREDEVEPVLADLPRAFAETAIDLLVLRGTLAIAQNQFGQAIALSKQIEAQLEMLEPNESNQMLRGLAVINLAYIYHIQGDSLRAQENYEASVAINRESGNLLAVVGAVRGWSALLIEQARLHEAEAVIHDGIKTEREWANRMGDADRKLVVAAPLHIYLGQLYYQWNRLHEAETQLVDAVKLVALSDAPSQCQGLTALAELRLAQGQMEAVPPILAQLEEIERSANTHRLRRQMSGSLAAIRCGLYRQQPSPELRAAIERSLTLLEGETADPLAHARILVTLNRADEAVPLLEKLAGGYEAAGRYGPWLSTAVLLCLAHQGRGEKKAALSWLSGAVKKAAAAGFIRLFLDEGEPLQRLLKELKKQKSAPDYAVTLLAAFPPPVHPVTPPTVKDALSPREREVLRLIAGGLSNKEIAAELVIAPSTAKRHTINIYNKLGTNNRAEATATAYQLGIVELE